MSGIVWAVARAFTWQRQAGSGPHTPVTKASLGGDNSALPQASALVGILDTLPPRRTTSQVPLGAEP